MPTATKNPNADAMSPPCPAPATVSPAVTGLAARLRGSAAPTPVPLPTAIRRVLPSLSWLTETPDAVVQFPDEVAALTERVEDAMCALRAMQELTDAAEVVRYLSMMAERRGMEL